MTKVKMTLLIDENVRNIFHKLAKFDGKTPAEELELLMAGRFSMEEIEEAQKRRMANKLIK